MNKKGLTLAELVITGGIILLLAGLVISSIFNRSGQSGPAISLPVTSKEKIEIENSPKTNLGEKFICESVAVSSLLPQGSDIQEEIVQWQRKNPSAKIVSILPVKKNEVCIGALVITAYAPR